ncbi:calpain-like cysteine peptidase, putative, (fragment), partial [Trypanosoma vivax Y486]
KDSRWTAELRTVLDPDQCNTIYVPVDVFREAFTGIDKALLRGLVQPAWHFNSEWGDGTNGGNPTLVTWRENPLYVVRNTSDNPIQITAMIGQPDQRHMLHLLPGQDFDYLQCGFILARNTTSNPIPTYLVTSNNHRLVHKGLFVNFRDTADIIIIPPLSMSYIVPSAMYRDKTKFLLSYWYSKPADARQVKIERLTLNVARDLPAIEHLELRNKEKGRVDFVVDVPTDIHVLVRQDKPCAAATVGDAMADNFLGIYLYDSSDKRIHGVTSATNYRETGIVHRLPAAGRYALSITCPRGSGVVPCKVEIVGVAEAKVRITDAPENAGELGGVDLQFLDAEPHGVPLDDLPLDDDDELSLLLDELQKLHDDPDGNAKEIVALEARVSDRVHTMAMRLLGKDRPKYLPGYDRDMLNPFLDNSSEYISLESVRHALKKDPRNATKIRNVEKELHALAGQISVQATDPDLSFLGAEVDGIPVGDISLMNDKAFCEVAMMRVQLKRDAVANASRISDLEVGMIERAHELAREMHVRERAFLDQEPEGVPLDLLPLNEDDGFSITEDRLRALNRKARKDVRLVSSVEDELSERAHELAAELKESERTLFLDPQPKGFALAELPLDEDSVFHGLEVQRLRLRKADAEGNVAAIKVLEKQMNERALELAWAKLRSYRAFLDPMPLGIPIQNLCLDSDSGFLSKEAELRVLLRDPRRNAAAIRAVEEELSRIVEGIAARHAALERDFLAAEYEGRPVDGLPLSDDKTFLSLEARRRQLVAGGGSGRDVRALEEEMGTLACSIARALNVKERPDYLSAYTKGVPLEDLPLDSDDAFRKLEVRRQQVKSDPRRGPADVADVEKSLQERAECLAKRRLSADRGYLDPAPAGVPLRLLPLDADDAFESLETQRALLTKNTRRNAKSIAALEGDLNERAHELAVALKRAERARFLDPVPSGIPLADVPIDSDDAFYDAEIRRLVLREDLEGNAAAISELEDAMNARAFELAGKVREKMRTFLDPMPLGIPLEELDLDAEEAFVAAENELHELRRDPRRNAAAIATLETGLRKLVYQIAARVVARERAFLDSDPEGRELAELPLNDDKEFRELEAERRWLKKDPHKNAARIAEVEERLNERAHELARAINCAERKAYLGSDPWGVSVADLPLDTDREFCKLELRRAFLMRDRERNKRQIEELEEALDRRAEELARRRLEEERGFLDREPQGIPLALLALDEDAAFHAKEVERLALKEQNLRRNEGRIRDLEDAMGERANEIARQVRLRERERLLGTAVGGVSLDVLCLDRDAPYVELEVAYVKGLRGGGDAGAVADIADAMRKRCGDILHRLKCEARSTLEPCPLGVPLEDLPLDESEVFVGREQALLELRSAPVHNAAAVAAAVQALNSITMELAREHVKGERDFLDREPEGRLISELPLNEDATFLGLEKQRRQLKKDPFMDEYRLADIEQLMNDRAHELAKKLNAAERTYFLALSVHGVPVSELPLDGDGEFARLEAERARLRRSPARCAARLEEVEDALSRRAEELAMDALQQDRLFLGEELEGVPVRHLPLSEDVEFSALESKRAALKGRDPQLCAKAICDLEEQLRDRAAELAIGVKGELRALLAPHPLGVPLAALPLDDDERFYALEQNYRELSADPTNAKKRDEILSQLNDRAIEMARCLHAEERAALDQRPEGIPLSVLPLNEDETFNTLETEARLLRCGSVSRRRNCARLQELEDAMNDRAVELARELRQSYCDAAPAGVPLELLALGGVSEFTKMEESLFELRKDPKANKKAISDLEFELNNMARTAARTMLEKDRGYLEDGPSGASLRALPIDVDPVFHALEVERAVLRSKGDRRNSRRVRELEEKLIERAQALAEEQLAEDLSGLDKEPEGIPLSQLGLQSDAAFGEMVRVIRELKKDPKKHAAAIEDARERMNDRAHELAQEKLVSDRAYLDRRPEGVPLEILPLCSDAVFRRLEVERARLKARDPVRNAGKIRDAEARLNDRVAELAQEQKQLDLRDLNQTPRGVPIHILDLHSDPVFQGMVDELRVMRSRPHTRVPDLASLLRRMDAHADAVAAERLRADRGYLEPDPLGVPLSRLRLSTDPVFCDLEAQRAVQKSQDARRNAARIADLEARLVSRVAELAQEQRERELEGLDPAPEGIPLAVLDPHSDGEFAVLVDALRALPDGPQADGDAAALRAAMNERVHALARGHRAHARGQLDSDPEGVL